VLRDTDLSQRIPTTLPKTRPRPQWWLLSVPPLLWLGLFFAAPLGLTVVYAFAHPLFADVRLGFTIVNFKQALSGFYLDIFLRTLEFAAAGTALCLLVSTPVAYVVARKAGRFKSVLLVLLLIPFWTSFLVRTLSWKTLLAPGGLIQGVLNTLHLHSGTLDVLDTRTAVFIGIVYAYLPLSAIPLFVAFERIPESVIESSRDVGASPLRTFFNVTLRMARPGIATAVLLTFVPMTGEYVIPALLGGDRGVLMGGAIASQYLEAANYPLGAAMSVLVLVVLGAAVAVLTRASRSFAEVPR
jgi:spermidine/putrescine transport system permease protein